MHKICSNRVDLKYFCNHDYLQAKLRVGRAKLMAGHEIITDHKSTFAECYEASDEYRKAQCVPGLRATPECIPKKRFGIYRYSNSSAVKLISNRAPYHSKEYKALAREFVQVGSNSVRLKHR